LIEIGLVAQQAGGKALTGHDELLSCRRRSRQPCARLSAHSGRKEFIESTDCDGSLQVDAVLSADTAAP